MKRIQTEEQFQEILKSPRWYGLLSYFIPIRIECPYPQEYEPLVHALQIRKRTERLAYLYDNACDRIDHYNEEHGLICMFHNSRCGLPPKEGRLNGCCFRCRYQTAKGCPSRNLSCKFYFCSRMQEKHPLTFSDFPEFRILSRRQQYMIKSNPYCTRETFLTLLNIGSLIIYLLYSTRKAIDMEIADVNNRKGKYNR